MILIIINRKCNERVVEFFRSHGIVFERFCRPQLIDDFLRKVSWVANCGGEMPHQEHYA